MARKHAGPNLYELMGGARSANGTNGAADPPPSTAQAPTPRFEVDDPPEPVRHGGGILSAGRALRVPVGHLFIAGAAVVAIASLVYMFAYNRGNDSGRSTAQEDIKALSEADQIGRSTVDPLLRNGGGSSTANQSGGRPGVDPHRQAGGPNRGSAGGGGRSGATSREPMFGPITADPRREGSNYLNLAAYSRRGAIELAEFCRERGLEAYVWKGNNSSYYQVFLLPGFEPGQLQSPEARKLRDDARAVGRAWHAQNPGQHDDLGNSYFARY